MIKKYYDQDCNLGMLDGKTVAIIGFGSQGPAHTKKAEAAGLKVVGIEEAAEAGDIVMILTPDELQASIYKNQIEKHMKEGNVLAFAHGFNIHFNQIQPADYLDVIMIAPKGPGHTVRSQYVEGKGVPSLIAVYQDASGKAKDYALRRRNRTDEGWFRYSGRSWLCSGNGLLRMYPRNEADRRPDQRRRFRQDEILHLQHC